jgi:hypothetical protein
MMPQERGCLSSKEGGGLPSFNMPIYRYVLPAPKRSSLSCSHRSTWMVAYWSAVSTASLADSTEDGLWVVLLSGISAATSSGSRIIYWPFSISKPLVWASFSTRSSVSLSTKTRLTRLPVALSIVLKVIPSDGGCSGVQRDPARNLTELYEPLLLGALSCRHDAYSESLGDDSKTCQCHSFGLERIIFQKLTESRSEIDSGGNAVLMVEMTVVHGERRTKDIEVGLAEMAFIESGESFRQFAYPPRRRPVFH